MTYKIALLRSIVLVLMIAISHLSFAQSSFPVSGKITDDKGQPLEGVSVSEKGTTNAVITRTDGSYQINVRSGQATLVMSFVGFVSQEIPVEYLSCVI